MTRKFKSLDILTLIVILIILIFFIWVIYILLSPSYSASNEIHINHTVENKIQHVLQNYSNILGFEVTNIDLVKNREYLVYARFSDLSLQQEFQDIMRSRTVFLGPVFGEEYTENNSAVVKALNGSFSCMPFNQSLESRYITTKSVKVSTVCLMSVPPDHHPVKGMLTIFLMQPPDTYEAEIYKMIISDIGSSINNR